jgi:hypothetical protein
MQIMNQVDNVQICKMANVQIINQTVLQILKVLNFRIYSKKF